MDDTPPPPMYLAGMGTITAIGADTAMTAAAVRARVSGYQASRFFTQGSRQPITLARVPSAVFESARMQPGHDPRIEEGHPKRKVYPG